MLLWIVIFRTYMLARQRLIASAAMRDAEDSSPPLARAAPAAAVSVADELVKLADLRDRGALTEAEFEAHKAALRPPSPPTGF
jgi:hypothetical protein